MNVESIAFLEKDEKLKEGKPPNTSKVINRSQCYMYIIKSCKWID